MRVLPSRNALPRLAAASLLAVALLLTSACAEGTSLPTGVGQLSSLCGAYGNVIDPFPLDIPAEEGNAGRNLEAERTIEELRAETASLRDAVTTVGASQTKQAFERFVQETARSLQTAATEVGRIGTPVDWLEVQRRLNASVEGADERLRDSMDDAGVDLREECG